MQEESREEIVHRTLVSIAHVRKELDAEESRRLREAEELRIWESHGHGSMLDYMERVLGYKPRAAVDRIRVARALGDLPMMEDALASGALHWTAVRELVRVATKDTEAHWIDEALNMNLREVEELVAGRMKGDLPEHAPDPDIQLRAMTFEITPETHALLREARKILGDECGEALDDDAFLTMLTRRATEPPEPSRAQHQIAITVCKICDRGFLDGAGKVVDLSEESLERCRCDAEHIGDLTDAPTRSYQDIPPATRRFVWRRDHGRCQFPGCRASRHLDIHHIVFEEHGGTHDPSNLTLMCSAHHRGIHEGWIVLRGTAPNDLIFERQKHVMRIYEGLRDLVGKRIDPRGFWESRANTVQDV